MNTFMNPQRGSKRPVVNPAAGEWGFVESALLSRHAPEPSATPMKIKCPTCNQKIESQIETETYSKTHFWAAALCMVLVAMPCFWIPYIIDSCKKKHHYCPKCRMYLGTFLG
ncbi:unnamed protein product [Diamesa serratosioi]